LDFGWANRLIVEIRAFALRVTLAFLLLLLLLLPLVLALLPRRRRFCFCFLPCPAGSSIPASDMSLLWRHVCAVQARTVLLEP
jgi:hypothetical protein